MMEPIPRYLPREKSPRRYRLESKWVSKKQQGVPLAGLPQLRVGEGEWELGKVSHWPASSSRESGEGEREAAPSSAALSRRMAYGQSSPKYRAAVF